MCVHGHTWMTQVWVSQLIFLIVQRADWKPRFIITAVFRVLTQSNGVGWLRLDSQSQLSRNAS